MGRLLEWVLRLWAGCLALFAVLWLVGPFGLGLVLGGALPEPLAQLSFQQTPLEGLLAGPTFDVALSESLTYDYLSGVQRASIDVGPGAYGDLGLDPYLAFSVLGSGQSWAFTALHVVPLLVSAALWWSLAGVVARSRSESAFTAANARRLRAAGVVVGLGAPLLTLLTWLLHRWVLATSQYAGQASVPWPGLDAWPWAAIALGLALVVLGGVWERGMTLTELAARVGVTVVNLSVLKNDRARAIRFSTLTAICEALECDVGDVLRLD